jgi:hypothetical protein
MNSRLVLPLLASACCVVSACAPLRNIERTRSERTPMAGGYSRSADKHDPASAAAFAAREESRRTGMPIRVVRILKSDTQVAAGTNLRMRIAAQRNGASSETAEVLVFRDLTGHLHLSSWRWVNR